VSARTGYRNMINGLDTVTVYKESIQGQDAGKDTETEFMDCMNIGKSERDRKRQGKATCITLGNDTYSKHGSTGIGKA
jgi:hypothetical protein